ncbi:hypothetical protein [Halomonas sp. 5021]|uniref:hypothetical protein n=1 Tax=Halomonas sp. 5021 TaxID=3082156 RepID=UPI002FCB99FE
MKTRGPQAYPTHKQRQELARMLVDMASEGDVNAAGWLLLLSEIRQQRRETTQ